MPSLNVQNLIMFIEVNLSFCRIVLSVCVFERSNYTEIVTFCVFSKARRGKPSYKTNEILHWTVDQFLCWRRFQPHLCVLTMFLPLKRVNSKLPL